MRLIVGHVRNLKVGDEIVLKEKRLGSETDPLKSKKYLTLVH